MQGNIYLILDWEGFLSIEEKSDDFHYVKIEKLLCQKYNKQTNKQTNTIKK